MLERCVKIARGSYLFCDTDSMCIVSTRNGSLIPVRVETASKRQGSLKALSFKQVDSIADRFNQLNPYNPFLVKEILKIEDINHIDSDKKKPRRQLFGYAIFAKRYALYGSRKRYFYCESERARAWIYFRTKRTKPNEMKTTMKMKMKSQNGS